MHFIKYSQKNNNSLLFNGLTFVILGLFFIFIAWGLKQMNAPIAILTQEPVTLDYTNLFNYSLRTLLRMLIAMIISLGFTFIYGTLAAKSKKCEQIFIPLLDILQSLPILGYISFTVTAFLALFPASVMGAECAAIFAIFTSQAWNMTFSFYYSLNTIPQELQEVAYIFKMSSWRKFWQINVPYAIPSLVGNIGISISSGWFFVVASEVITVGNSNITLPGIGSYIALALEQKNLHAIGYALLAMSLVIILYDQLLLRPLNAWADKFHYKMTPGSNVPTSWVLSLFYRSRIIKKLALPVYYLGRLILYTPIFNKYGIKNTNMLVNSSHPLLTLLDYVWYIILLVIGGVSIYYISCFLYYDIGFAEVLYVFKLGLATLARVVVLIIIAALIWVPIGIYIGLNPKIASFAQPVAQFLAAFPVNLLFPVVFIVISHYHLNPNIWLSPLMIVGTQWYILFNVIIGASSIPNELKDATIILRVKGWSWWYKVMLPAILPYFIVGAITASGGAWNTSIVAEIITFGGQTMTAYGLGSYITQMTITADFNKIVLGMGVMALLVIFFNRLVWRPLHEYCLNRFKI